MKTICFTGHRSCHHTEWLYDALNGAVERAVEAGAGWFTSGGAPGWDLRFLEAAMVERWTFAGKPTVVGKGMFDVQGLPDGIVVAAALPFPGFWDYYKEKRDDDRIYFNNLASQLDMIAYVDQGTYTPAKMHQRNRWLVDEHDAVIAVYDGRKTGGTYATLQYARKQGKPILWLNPVKETERWIRK
jgi:hypothetical protein